MALLACFEASSVVLKSFLKEAFCKLFSEMRSYLQGYQMVYLNTKIPILVCFGGHWNGKWIYFMVILYIFANWINFVVIWYILVRCNKKSGNPSESSASLVRGKVFSLERVI
jgi:hypothetical protein